MIEVKRGERYRHLKSGGTYHVRAVGRDEETLERVVTYEAIDPATWNQIEPRDKHTWTRRLSVFADGRFELVTRKT